MRLLGLLVVSLFSLSSFAAVFNILDFGAESGNGLQTVYIQAAIDSAERAGGGTVLIPTGVFQSGTIFLKDNVILEIAAGATLKGSPKLNQYPVVIPSIRSFTDEYPQRSLIYAEGKRNIGITGQGTIDGSGQSLDFLLNDDDKPFGVRFIGCTNVLYEGITMKTSGFWMMHNLNCDSLTIRNLKINNHNFGNGDGINIDGCTNVLVENCTVDSNDDPMVIKTTNEEPAENIEVKNCTFATYSRAIKVGTETYGPVRNVHIHDCEVKYSTLGPFGDRFPADCGIQLSIVDGGAMDNVVLENINITGVNTPIFIRLGDRNVPFNEGGPQPPMGSLKNVLLQNISIDAISSVSSSITGIPGFPVENITLKDIDIIVQGGENAPGPGLVIPENPNDKPGHDMFGEYLPAYGFFVRHATDLTFDNVCITTRQNDDRPEYYFEDTSGVSITACRVTAISKNFSDESVLYPNPSSNWLYLEQLQKVLGKNAYCLVTDLAGRMVLEKEMKDLPDGRLNISRLPVGTYMIYFRDGEEGIYSSRFVKM